MFCTHNIVLLTSITWNIITKLYTATIKCIILLHSKLFINNDLFHYVTQNSVLKVTIRSE